MSEITAAHRCVLELAGWEEGNTAHPDCDPIMDWFGPQGQMRTVRELCLDGIDANLIHDALLALTEEQWDELDIYLDEAFSEATTDHGDDLRWSKWILTATETIADCIGEVGRDER